MRFRCVTVLVSLAAGLAAAAPARAQTVHGTLVDTAGRPVEQVLVALLGPGGRQVGGALTSARGEFRIRAPGAGRYSLRAERVGYATAATPTFELREGETREERVVAAGRAVALQGLVVTPRNRRCAVRPGAGLATATLWEEARKALAAAEFSSRAGLFWYDVVRWKRNLTLDGAVTRDLRQTGSGITELPFVSVPPAVLSREGFIRRMDDSLVYAAPDAAVLLSDEFLDDHCFRVATGSDPSLVGLEFEPTSSRMADVRGVLWLDRATAELRRVEYRYVHGPPESTAPEVGGSVEFERLRGGPWIVRRWAIRMPIAEARVVRGITAPGSRPFTHSLNLLGMHEAGGEVVSARLVQGGAAIGEVIARAGAPAVVEGVVWDSLARAPLAGAHVFLSGTGAEAVTDVEGRYRLEAPTAGTYAITFSQPALGPLSAAVSPRTVTAVAGRATRADLAVPSPARVTAALCPAGTLRTFGGVVAGRVLGLAPDSVAVRARWQHVSVGGRVVSGASNWTETRPDAAGFYVLCGVLEGGPVEVAVRPARQTRQRTTAGALQDQATRGLRATGNELSRVEVTVSPGVPFRLDVGPGARSP